MQHKKHTHIKWLPWCFSLVIGMYGLSSCEAVKPYQRAYLNDNAMQTGKQPLKRLNSNMHSYREGASGGGRGKSSGGCGCN